jgi:hypothetical protein
MTRLVRWLVVAAATLASFVLGLWVGWLGGIELWPDELQSAQDRWVVAAAFGAALASIVLAGGAFWSGRRAKSEVRSDQGSGSEIQKVRVRDGIAYVVMKGNQHIGKPNGRKDTKRRIRDDSK